ncbi:hypothetical protein QBC38DRAFT_46688 [Podospora fimiseda]|uniref:Uncharacterized protein n=1 Tax=Podospora fimiseda TaxID=252190 RepID=A0AAN7BHH1_9PEZI|nr:hypothetical protein QBC38DRAFT_46688 [Podospora fimiseda]
MDQQQPSAIVDDAQQQQPISDHHRPVAVPVPSTRPPSFATYPPSVYHPPPSSVQSYSHRQQQHQYQPSERLETHHEGLSPSSSSVLQVPIIHQLPAHQLQRIIPYSPSWHKTKIIIRSLTCLWEFIIIVLCVITVIRFSPSNWDDRGIQAWNAVLPIVAVLILYDIVELGTFCLRWRIKRGLHPAVTVTADLLCLMAVVLGLTFNLHNASITSGGYYGVMVLSCEGILGLIFVGHLVLFVRACVETRQRHKSKESTGLAYVYSPAGGKPFPILAAPGAPGKDLGAAGSEAGWTATTVNGFESSAQQQQQFQQSQQHLPVQAVPLQRMVISPSLGRKYGWIGEWI